MKSIENEQSNRNSHLRMAGVVGIAMGVTNLIDLNNSVQEEVEKDMGKSTQVEVTHAKTILSEAGDDYWQTEDLSTFKEPAVVAAKKVINQKDKFYAEAWNRIAGDHQPRIVFSALLIGGGLTLRNRIKKEEKPNP